MRMQLGVMVVAVLLGAQVLRVPLASAAAPVEQAPAVTPVVLYTTEGCGYCAQAVQWLNARGVAFEQRDIGDAKVAAELRARGGQGVPHAFFGDIGVAGFQPERYARLLGPR